MIKELGQVTAQLKKRISKAQQDLDQAEENLVLLNNTIKEINSGNFIYLSVLVDILEVNQETFYNILETEAIKAAVNTKEYDYDLYLNRLRESIPLADIIVKYMNNSLVVEINMDKVGNIRTWGQAVSAYRDTHTTRKITRKRHLKEGGTNLAYHLWVEKIYKPAREGGKVYRRVYNKHTRSYDSQKDVTGQYVGKYRDTIKGQLDLVTGAPFWYLIEHGNANPPGFKVVAPAYPKVSAQNFISKTKLAIKEYIQEQLRSRLPKKESDWIKLLADKLDVTITPQLQDLLDKYDSKLVLLINNMEDINKLHINDVLGIIKDTKKSFSIVLTGKSLGLRFNLREKNL